MVDVVEAFAPLASDEISSALTPVSDSELVLPVPTDAPPMPETHFMLGLPSTRWHYRDPAGAVLFAVVRFDKPDGGKEFWPLTLWRGGQGLLWRWKSVPCLSGWLPLMLPGGSSPRCRDSCT
jgi:putative DNA primase/helicase